MLDSSKKQILSQILKTVGILGGLAASGLLIAIHLNGSISSVFEKKQELDLRKIGTTELTSLIEQANQAAALTAKLTNLLPDQTQAAKFPEVVLAQASKNRVASEINLTDTLMPKPDQPGGLMFNIKSTGAYSDLFNFLRNLESGTIPFAFESTELTRVDDHFELAAKIKVFFK